MIHVNLLPQETEYAARRRQQLSIAALALSITLLVMVVPYVLQKRTLSHLDVEIEELNTQIATLDEQTVEARNLERKKRELRAKIYVISDLDHKRVGPARVLSDLSLATPEKLWIEEFVEAADVVTLTGWSLDNQTVALFMRQLDESPYFYNVDLSEATQPNQQTEAARGITGVNGVRLKRFVVRASLDYFGRNGKAPPKETDGASAQTETRIDT